MNLRVHEVGSDRRQRIEHLMPPRGWEQQHVVGRRLRLRARWQPDLLEQRVGLREVDHAIHADADRCEPGALDRDGVAGRGVEVGGRLLCDQHAGRRTGKVADHTREHRSVSRGQAEHHTRPGGLRTRSGCRRESTGRRELHRERATYAGRRLRGCKHGGGVRPGLGLHLPVDADRRHGACGHRGFRCGEEGADRGEQRDGDGDPCRGGDEACAAPGDEPAHPCQTEHGSSRTERG